MAAVSNHLNCDLKYHILEKVTFWMKISEKYMTVFLFKLRSLTGTKEMRQIAPVIMLRRYSRHGLERPLSVVQKDVSWCMIQTVMKPQCPTATGINQYPKWAVKKAMATARDEMSNSLDTNCTKEAVLVITCRSPLYDLESDRWWTERDQLSCTIDVTITDTWMASVPRIERGRERERVCEGTKWWKGQKSLNVNTRHLIRIDGRAMNHHLFLRSFHPLFLFLSPSSFYLSSSKSCSFESFLWLKIRGEKFDFSGNFGSDFLYGLKHDIKTWRQLN